MLDASFVCKNTKHLNERIQLLSYIIYIYTKTQQFQINENHGTRVSKDKDLLIVEEEQ